MRLIFCNHDVASSRDIVGAFAARLPLEGVDVIEGPNFVPPPDVPCTAFSRQDIYFEGYDVDWSAVEPLDQERADRLWQAEILGLRMFDRYQKYLNHLRRMELLARDGELGFFGFDRHYSYAERKRLFLRHVRFWLDRIERTRPAALIHLNGSPHLVAEFVIFEICRQLGIKTFFLTFTPITPKVLLTSDLGRYVGNLAARTADHLARFRADGSLPEVDAVTRAFIGQQTGADAAAHPAHLNSRNISLSRGYFLMPPATIAKMVAKDSLDVLSRRRPIAFAALKYLLYLELKLADRHLHRRYEELSVSADLRQPFIYLPLHYQPEETTSPLGGIFENQLLIAEMLSFHAPDGWKIYVKEHPAQNSYGREPILYKELLRLRNVVLVRKDTNSFDLIRHSRAVATVAGSAGWEGLMRGKPVLVFGHVPYSEAPGAFRIRTSADCRHAMRRIETGDVEVTIETMTCFLRALQDCAFDFRLNTAGASLPGAHAEIPRQQNIANLVDAVVAALGLAATERRKSV